VQVSAKSDYALRALVHLARHYKGTASEPVSIRVLAEANDIPKRFLEHIMIELRHQGWVNPLAGRAGGFVLAKPPSDITLAQVIRYFDGALAPIDCVSVKQYTPCSQEETCGFRRVFLEIRNYAAERLEQTTLSSVVDSPAVTKLEISGGRGFRDGDGI
jgi:Rrf2 family protein